jgi:hypothetical protein
MVGDRLELEGEGSLGMASIKADDRQAVLAQLQGQPVGHLPRLKADARRPGHARAPPG